MAPLLKLLIVDDETRFLKTISQRLRLRGLDVHTAANGPDAIALAHEHRFDVALLDLKMPGMDGSEVHLALRARDPHLETIVLTGHGSLTSAVELSQLGAYRYLPKPYEMEKLLATIAGAFARRLSGQLGAGERAQRIEAAAADPDPLAALRRLREIADEV